MVIIPQYVQVVMNKLISAGYECYLVGGCVRDALMGKTPNDYDLTTSALPEQTLSAFSNRRVIETGLKHGTVTVLTDAGGVEVTTYRIDGKYTDNRRPDSVSFTRNLVDDLARRDFTVNAMAMSMSGDIVDVFGGGQDLADKIIRCVGDPCLRFEEDGLRIIRALRFAAVLDFNIAPDTSDAVHSMYRLLDGISAERIREELFKLICGSAAMRVMTDYSDVICYLLAGLDKSKYTSALDAVTASPNDPLVRMAVLYAMAGDDPETGLDVAMHALKCSRHQIKSAADCLSVIISPPKAAPTDIALFAAHIGLHQLKTALDAAIVCQSTSAPRISSLLTDMQNRDVCFRLSDLAIDGSMLISIGIKPGKRVGDILHRLFCAVAEGECSNNKADLLELAKTLNKGVN